MIAPTEPHFHRLSSAEVEQEKLPLSADSLVPAQLLSDDEVVILAMKPSLWFIILVSFPWLVVGIPIALACWWRKDITYFDYAGQIALASVLGRLFFAVIQWLARFYVLTDRRILRIAGIFNIVVFECALIRIQNTNLLLSLGQRIVGVGTLLFATAGASNADAAWIHVHDPLEVQQQVQNAIENARRRYGTGDP
jgi:uncharacterized membrane protein YdbT with pleckstrin-like domain